MQITHNSFFSPALVILGKQNCYIKNTATTIFDSDYSNTMEIKFACTLPLF